ncbi:hypothetical protein Tco_0169950 [Tanacetum coccineum]
MIPLYLSFCLLLVGRLPKSKVKVDMKELTKQGIMESQLGQGSWQLHVAIVYFRGSSDPVLAKAVVAKAVVTPTALAIKKSERLVALTICHSTSSELQVKVDKKTLIEKGIMESRLGQGSWQLLVSIVRFPESSDPGEARHIERRGSIPSRQPVLLPAYLTPCSEQGHSESAPHMRIPLSSVLQECSLPEDPSLRLSFVAPTKCHSASSELHLKVDKKELIEQGIIESRLGRGSWQLPVAIVHFPESSDQVKLAISNDAALYPQGRLTATMYMYGVSKNSSSFLAKAVVAKVVVAPTALAIKKLEMLFLINQKESLYISCRVALTKFHSASSELQVKVNMKPLIEQGIMESRLGRGSWQLHVAIIRFLGSSDLGEARHIERRGSIPSGQVRGNKKDKSIQILSLPRGEVSSVREALVKPTCLFSMFGFVFRVTTTMYMYGVSKNSSSFLAKEVVAKAVVAPAALAIKKSEVALTKCHSESSKLQVKVDKKALIEKGIMESRLGRGSWQLPVAIVRFPGSSNPNEARHIKQRGSIPPRKVRGKKKAKSIQLLSLPRGEVRRVREALVKPTYLFGMSGFVFWLSTTMYMYGVSKNSSSCCYIIVIAVVAKAVVAICCC